MKKIITLGLGLNAIFLGLSLNTFAQNEDDALRYANTKFGGTARSNALAGAFGALGSDFSSLSINPAGIGLYRKSEFTFSPTLGAASTQSNYFGEGYKDDRYQFSISNFGMVIAGTKESKANKWKGLGLAFGYNRLANFNNRAVIQGNNGTNSLTDVYLSEAKSVDPSNLPAFGTDMAWSTYLIDTLNGGTYFSSMPSNINKTQRKTIEKRGGMGETVISFGGNYDNKLFMGATVGFQKIRYWEESNYSESPVTDTFDIKGFTVNNYLNTDGNGVNVKLGMIYMPVPFVRIGGAFHTPTFFNMHDNYSAGMTTSFNDGTTINAGTDANGGGDKGNYDYRYNSPFKAIGSLAFIFGKYGLISADYEYVDYREARFRAVGYSFIEQNNTIRDKYKAVGNIRLGSEIKLDPFSIRFGYALYASPFKDKSLMSDQQFFTGGFGYRQDGFFADIAYVRSTHNEKYYLYNSNFNPTPSTNKLASGSIVATVGVRF
jgi:hypothetical protein